MSVLHAESYGVHRSAEYKGRKERKEKRDRVSVAGRCRH